MATKTELTTKIADLKKRATNKSLPASAVTALETMIAKLEKELAAIKDDAPVAPTKKTELTSKIADLKKRATNKSLPASAVTALETMIAKLEKELAELKDEPFANSGANYNPKFIDNTDDYTDAVVDELEISSKMNAKSAKNLIDSNYLGFINSQFAAHKTPKETAVAILFKTAKKSTNSTETITQKLINTLTDIGIDLEGEDETSIAATRMELEESDNDTEAVDKIIKDYEENWLTDLAKKPQSEVKKAFSDYYKAIGGKAKKSDLAAKIIKNIKPIKQADIDKSIKEIEKTDFHVSVKHIITRNLTDNEQDYLTERGVDFEENDTDKDDQIELVLSNASGHKTKNAETIENIFKDALGSKQEYSGTVKSKAKKAAEKASTSKEAEDEEGEYLVNFYDSEDELIESTELDEKNEQLAWDLFKEFGHIKKAGMYLEFDKIIKSKSKGENKSSKKEATKASTSKEAYDCDDLIAKEIERKAKRNESAAKTEKKPAITKNIEAVEKVVERAEKQFKDGDLTKAQIIKMIAELHARIKDLEKLLKTAK